MSSLLEFTSELASLKFNREVSIAPGHTLRERPLLTIAFKLDSHLLRGEAPLLPGYLPLTSDDILQKLALIKRSERALHQYDLSLPYFGLFKGPASPQAMFALEGALLQFLIQCSYLKAPKRLVPIRPLLFALPDFDLSSLPKNQVAIKAKIGRGPLSEDINFLRAVRELNPKASLCVDPNRALSENEERTLEGLDDELGIEALELTLEEAKKSGFKNKIHLDTNLTEIKKSEIPANVTGLVYKPARDGAFSALSKWAQDYKLTLSSTYESALGLNHMAMAALVFELQGPQGLGTYQYLKNMELSSELWFETDLNK